MRLRRLGLRPRIARSGAQEGQVGVYDLNPFLGLKTGGFEGPKTREKRVFPGGGGPIPGNRTNPHASRKKVFFSGWGDPPEIMCP